MRLNIQMLSLMRKKTSRVKVTRREKMRMLMMIVNYDEQDKLNQN